MDDDPLTGNEPALPSDSGMSGYEPLLGGGKPLEQILSASSEFRLAATEILADALAGDLPRLVAMLREGDSRRRSIALRLIGMLAVSHPPSRSQTIPVLVNVLNEACVFRNRLKVRQIVEWLGNTGDSRAAAVLVEMLDRHNLWVPIEVVIGAVGRLGEAAVPALTQAATACPPNSLREDLLFQALILVCRTHPHTAPQLGSWITPLILSRRISLEQYSVRKFIGLAYSEELIDGLIAIAMNRELDPSFRRRTVNGLGYITSPRVVEFLFRLLSDDDKFLRLIAARGLVRIRRRQDIPRLIALTRHDDPHVRRLAIWIIRRRRLRTALPVILAALSDPHPAVRQEAVTAAASYRDPSVIPSLLNALSDPRAEVRCKAITALMRFNDPALIPHLLAMRQDRAASVRRCAARVLRSFLWRSEG